MQQCTNQAKHNTRAKQKQINIKHEGLRAAFDLRHLFRVPLIIIILKTLPTTYH